MSVIVYQCDTCNREIELIRNPEGLEAIGRCIITDNCKGFLQQRSVKLETTNRRPPASVAGLTDWVQRRVLYTHTQSSGNDTWQVQHNLQSRPSIQTFVESEVDDNLIEVEPVSIEYIDGNQIILTFGSSLAGVCQCIARTAAFGTIQEFDDGVDDTRLDNMVQVTTSLEVTIATKLTEVEAPTVEIDIAYLSPTDLSERDVDPMTFVNIRNIPTSPWSPIQRIQIEGRLYQLRSMAIDLTNLQTGGVENGDPFYFKSINGDPINEDDVYLILTKPPHESVDKNYDQVIDVSVADVSSAADSFAVRDQELFVFDSILKNLYPPIQVSV